MIRRRASTPPRPWSFPCGMARTGDEGGEAPAVPQTLLRPPAVHRTNPVRWTAQTDQEKARG